MPKHASHWHGLELSGYVGGPFEDHTGGLITFDADEDRARDAVERDPFLLDGLLADHWLRRRAQSDAQPRQLRVYTDTDSTNS